MGEETSGENCFDLCDLRKHRRSRTSRANSRRGAARSLHQHLLAVRSIYHWNDTIETAHEVAAILKTHHRRSEALIERIAQLHSYEVPCIVTWPVDKILAEYADWVEAAVLREA
jgi:uncharacterized protein involved in tolerance to divalent cations